jgi:hypothetical protein
VVNNLDTGQEIKYVELIDLTVPLSIAHKILNYMDVLVKMLNLATNQVQTPTTAVDVLTGGKKASQFHHPQQDA